MKQGRRKHRFTYVRLPKGQGKSALLSAICLYVACFDGATNAEIYCVAGDRFQARIIFETYKEMVKADKRLMKACQIRRDHYPYQKRFKIMVISADAKKNTVSVLTLLHLMSCTYSQIRSFTIRWHGAYEDVE